MRPEPGTLLLFLPGELSSDVSDVLGHHRACHKASEGRGFPLYLQGGFSMNEATYPRIAADELAPTPPVGGVHQGDGSIGGGRCGIRVDEIILLNQK